MNTPTAFFFFLISSLAVLQFGKSEEQPLDWWQTAVIYQVYPLSFRDSDGNGVGDLNGITQKLDYLKDLGVGAVWLSPIYKSPMADFGYDISDFKDIDPIFGTLVDFENLQRRSKELGIKLILDFVPNHSSDQHEWFVKSAKREEPYTNYYVWSNGKFDPQTRERSVPNNWLSAFRGSAWTWNDDREQYYLHQFAPEQPDLNYRNPAVVEEMKNVIRFWLNKGVDGFRMDAIPFLYENPSLADEAPTGDPNAAPGDHGTLVHNLTQNLPETYDMITQWRAILDEKKAEDNVTRLMIVEAYADLDQTMAYYGNRTVPGGHLSFNFLFITNLNNDSSALQVKDTVDMWMREMTEERWPNWVIGNHDQPRVASRYGPELVDGINMLALLLPGSAITYNGEEIGMEDGFVSWNDTVDPRGINAGEDRYLIMSRDFERTPFQWDNSTSSGFSTNETTWLPVSWNYQQLNLENQKSAGKSHYKVYKKLVQTRNTTTIQKGDLNTTVISTNVFAFSRTLEGSPTYIVVINLGPEEEVANLTSVFSNLPQELNVYTASINSAHSTGDTLSSTDLHLRPKEALVLTTAAAS